MLNLHALKVPQKSIRLLAGIDRFQGRWEALEAHTTSLQLLGDVAAHGKDVRAVFEAFQALPISADMALKLNMALTRGIGGLRADDTPLRFEDGETVFGSIEGPSPLESEAFLKKIMAWLGKVLEDPEIHPLLAIAVLSAVLYQLAPFAAENARTIRQLVTILMFRMGYTYAPYALLEAPRGSAGLELFTRVLALKEGIEAGAPDWPGWIEYFLGILTARKNELSSRLEKDKSQLADMPELSRKILKLFDKQERLGMKEIERQTKGARATLKLRLGELVEGGYLKRHGQARSTWYARL